MTPISLPPTPFTEAVRALEPPVSPVVARTLDVVYRLIQGDENWRGACHMSTAVAHILLVQQGVNSTPCLGDVVTLRGPFDHSWLEIDGAIYDLAIAYPLEEHEDSALPPVIAGRHLPDGTPTELLYGAAPATYGRPALGNPSVEFIKRMSLTQYVDGAAEVGLDLWGIIIKLGQTLGLKMDKQMLKRRHMKTMWAIRDSVPVPSEMMSGWTILH